MQAMSHRTGFDNTRILPGLAAAGPYDQPYGLIESGDRSQTRNQERVAIAKIDGKSPRDPRRPEPLALEQQPQPVRGGVDDDALHPDLAGRDVRPDNRELGGRQGRSTLDAGQLLADRQRHLVNRSVGLIESRLENGMKHCGRPFL